jgi:hypothetical protein
MGLFDFMKSPEQKKKQETIDKLYREIFPGGKKQQDNEIQEVRHLLNFKYTKEAIEQAYIFAVVSYYTSEKPKLNDIIGAILRNPNTSVTFEDAKKVCLYIENKRYFKPTSSLIDTLSNKSDADKLFMIAFGGIVEIKKKYKDLTNFGKFEVLLFNSLISLQEYQSLHPDKYEEMSQGFFKNLFDQAKSFGIKMPPDEMANFVNSRFETYLEEIIRFFDEEEDGYMLLKIYTLFYEQPLELNPETSFDLFEYASFLPALIEMRRYIIEKANNIF